MAKSTRSKRGNSAGAAKATGAAPEAQPGALESEFIPPEVTPDAPETTETPTTDADPLHLGEPVVAAAPEPETPPEPEPEPEPDTEPQPERTADPEPVQAAPAAKPSPPPAPRRSGFFPLLLGGVIAALLGAAVLRFGVLEGWVDLGPSAATEALAGRVEGVETRLDDTGQELAALREAQPDLSGVEATIAANSERADALSGRADEIAGGLDALGERIDGLGGQLGTQGEALDALASQTETLAGDAANRAARIDALDARLDDLALQPIPEAKLPDEVVAAYDRQLQDMQDRLDARLAELSAAQEARLAELTAAQEARLAELQAGLDAKIEELEATQAATRAAEDAARAAQEAAEAAARAAERVALARTAFAGLQAALESGVPYAEELDVLVENTDVAIPDALSVLAADGVPTLADLQDSYVVAARAALIEATRAAREEGTIDPLTAFLRTQLGARSLEPREGDDADAILSRAEAALRGADLDATLAELSALPEAGQSEMATWIALAEARRDALAAAAQLADDLKPE